MYGRWTVVNILLGVAAIMKIGNIYLCETLTGVNLMLLLSNDSYSIGLGLLWMSTPPVLSNTAGMCSGYQAECIGQVQMILFYKSLPMIAFGLSAKFSLELFLMEHILSRHDASDFNRESATQKALGSVAVISFVLAPLVGGILLPFIRPWSVRFGIQAICTLVGTLAFVSGWCSYVSMKPLGSNLTRVFRVLVASALKVHLRTRRSVSQLYEMCEGNNGDDLVTHTTGLRCLGRAAFVEWSKPLEEQEKKRWTLCRVTEVEETKIFLRMIPMWVTILVFGIILPLGNTFFLEQAKNLNPKVGRAKVPLPLFLVFYQLSKVKVTEYYSKFERLFGAAKRKYAPAFGIGAGMILAILCCITAAKVEERRIHVIKEHKLVDKPDDIIPMTIFWVLPQYLLLAGLDALACASVKSVVCDQLPNSMILYMLQFSDAVFGTGMIAAVLSVHVAGNWSGRGGRQSWFGETVNKSRLDKYYRKLATLCAINFGLYVFMALLYVYIYALLHEEEVGEEVDDDDLCCCCC